MFFDKPIKPNEKSRLSIFLDLELKERLRVISAKECISLNQVARTFLEAMTDEYSKIGKRERELYADTETPWLYD